MRYLEIKHLSEQKLTEVSMSPTALQTFLNSPEAEGMTIGIEFEMGVPNVSSGDEGDELEVDYSMDEKAYNIRQIVTFFTEPEQAQMTGSEARQLQENLQEEHNEWQYAQLHGDWRAENLDEWDDYLRDGLKAEFPVSDFKEEAIERLGKLFDDPNDVYKLQRALQDEKVNQIIEDGEEQEYVHAINHANDELETSFYNSHGSSEEAWLRSIGITSMHDASIKWVLDWPYNITHSSEEDIAEIGDRFGHDMGVEVKTSTSYHGNSSGDRFDTWNIEPDGSISTEDGDRGLEFVSPVMPLKDGLNTITRMFDWATVNDCYTNSSTGMHINISVPDFDSSKVDYIKLALFSGDDYILQEFGRQYNSYTSSAIKLIKQHLNAKPFGVDANAWELISQMRQHLSLAASKGVINRNNQRQTSINLKDGWVEFRSPGGDYLNMEPEKLINTALRMAMALKISIDPNAHKQEYAKKLYKLAAGTAEATDPLNVFAQYLAAQITKDQLIQYLKTKKTRQIPEGTLQHWTVTLGWTSVDVVAKTKQEAVLRAKFTNPTWEFHRETAFSLTQTGVIATPAEVAAYQAEQ